MKAVGRNLIIKIKKEGTTKTTGGLLLAEKQREDIRYVEAVVISAGEDVAGIKVNDIENISGHPIAFTVNGTKYVQYLIKGLYGNS